MTPQKLTNETRDIGKPRNWDEAVHGSCESLSVHDSLDENGINWMISCWRPSPTELQALNDGESVQLYIAGVVHPVVSLCVN